MEPKEMNDHVDTILNETEAVLRGQGVDLFIVVGAAESDGPARLRIWTSDKATKGQIITSIFSAFGYIIGAMPDHGKVRALCDVLRLGSEFELLHMVKKVLDNPEEK